MMVIDFYRRRFLSTPFSIAVFTAAVFDRNRYDRNSMGSYHVVL
jgi:hypothetical protein